MQYLECMNKCIVFRVICTVFEYFFTCSFDQNCMTEHMFVCWSPGRCLLCCKRKFIWLITCYTKDNGFKQKLNKDLMLIWVLLYLLSCRYKRDHQDWETELDLAQCARFLIDWSRSRSHGQGAPLHAVFIYDLKSNEHVTDRGLSKI